MKHFHLLLISSLVLSVLFGVSGCNSENSYEVIPRLAETQQSYVYLQHIKPILDQKCVACHACNDAPCQLKLESSAGIERGASKQRVYDGSRLEDVKPTRLHFDAQTAQQWRDKGFYSVLAGPGEGGSDPSAALMYQFLALGRTHPVTEGKPLGSEYKLDINREHSCPAPGEFENYAKDNPNGGMPYGVSGLTEEEYQVLTTWVSQGAVVKRPSVELHDKQQKIVDQWETFLNTRDARSQLVARYLYEHLFLAHLYFSDEDAENGQFFQLVRSRTNAPHEIDVIATVRPNDNPGGEVFYRLRPITDTLVHKTHIIYRFDNARMERYQQLFLNSQWSLDQLPGYGYTESSNPFITFAAIPAKSRYQFMLDEAEYFVRTFIRGPVCRGQIATDVIRDQFWVMFEEPDTEQFVNNKKHHDKAASLLGLPGEKSHILSLGPEYLKYQENRNQYRRLRAQQYQRAFSLGMTLDNIWDGDGSNTNAFLTVFRHHDSASVERGWFGNTPITLWVMDYPLFERTYYELVVNFDVFGSVSHQAQTRLYFDLIRNGGETNFLLFLPKQHRQKIYDGWYEGSGQLKQALSYYELDVTTPTAVRFSGNQPTKQQFVQQALSKFAEVIPQDPLHRCGDNECSGKQDDPSIVASLQPLTLADGKNFKGIHLLPEVTVLRVDTGEGEYRVFSLIRNRAHTNVAFMLGEEQRYKPAADSLSLVDFPISSYPNYMFRVDQKALPQFVKALLAMGDESDREEVINRWGVRRADNDFWENFHSMSDYLKRTDPKQAGIFDLNRYEGW